MSNVKPIQAPERTVERGRGCWNCKHFNNEDLAKQHYKQRTMQEKMAIQARQAPILARLSDQDVDGREMAKKTAALMRQGFTEPEAQRIAHAELQRQLGGIVDQARRADARFQVFDRMVAAGQIGICVLGASQGDFVDHRFLCDKWSGVTGASVATEGKPLDKLPDELRDIVDGKAQKA
jgi:hypothetical protein